MKRIVLLLIIFLTWTAASHADTTRTITNSIGMKLIEVRAGKFLYGGKKETPRSQLWQPRFQTTITLTKDFYLGAHEVTQEQFQRVMESNPSKFKGGGNPVDSVTWPEANEFCEKLSELPEEKKAGRVYSLPTSAEWEYACRAGSDDIFYWNSEDETIIGRYAWCKDWYGKRSKKTHPIGKKKSNKWGFYDMLGNVWEWCIDGAGAGGAISVQTYYPKKEGWTDPHFQAKQKKYAPVIRGGSWNSDFRSANCFMVFGQRPLAREKDTGFRAKCMVVK